jgi:PAS domain S-box-containing protein
MKKIAQRPSSGSEVLARIVAEATPDATIVIDESSTILFVNQSSERVFGYVREELLGKQLTLLMPDYLRALHKQALRKYLQTGVKHLSWESVELPGLHKNGQEISVEISFGQFDIDGRHFFSGICRNVTERKRNQEARFQLAAIVESSDDAILSKNLDGIIKTWNKAAERIYGYTAEEVIGKPVSILTPPERRDETLQIMEKLRRGEQIKHYETERVTKEGRRIHISLTVSPVRDEIGRITGASAVGRDITERKRAEQEREQLVTELQGALAKVKLVSAFLPICASCKKVRDDRGYWEQVQVYIRDHSEAEFSHGLCPDCLRKLYPTSAAR